MYKSPVIAFEKVAQAHATLVEAIDSARQLRSESVIMAKQNIDRLNILASNANTDMLALSEENDMLGHGSDAKTRSGRL